MSAANHTPGPWSVVELTPNTVQTPSGRISVNWNATHDDGKRLNEAEANARLIAAAPELLDALELALEIIEATGPGSYPVAEEQIRAAIAKAKGGQS